MCNTRVGHTVNCTADYPALLKCQYQACMPALQPNTAWTQSTHCVCYAPKHQGSVKTHLAINLIQILKCCICSLGLLAQIGNQLCFVVRLLHSQQTVFVYLIEKPHYIPQVHWCSPWYSIQFQFNSIKKILSSSHSGHLKVSKPLNIQLWQGLIAVHSSPIISNTTKTPIVASILTVNWPFLVFLFTNKTTVQTVFKKDFSALP